MSLNTVWKPFCDTVIIPLCLFGHASLNNMHFIVSALSSLDKCIEIVVIGFNEENLLRTFKF